MIGVIVILSVILIVILWFVMAYNGLVRNRNGVKNAFHQIDVQLKRRHDLIPNLVETVKGYMKHEKETLENVIKARNIAMGAGNIKEQAAAENMLTGALKSLFAVTENYPDLKANQNVMQLQEELTGTENKISFSRQYYNDSVLRYNNMTETIPTNIVASMGNFKQADFFEAPEEEKEAPKVQF